MKTAFVSGLSGQDGSYLAELLLDKGYAVHGIIRRSSSFNTGRIDHIFDRLKIHYGDLTDGTGLARLMSSIRPDEIYNLAAMSHVRVSFDCPEYTVDANATGTLRLFEAIRLAGLEKTARIYQASSSEMFGGVNCPPAGYNEKSPFHPMSPYGCSKVFAFYQAVNYREAYGMHISNGILFNHESPRRGPTFVTQKIVRGLADIAKGRATKLHLGNLDAYRDWGYAPDYVEAMWLMLQQPMPNDFVIATGETHSVRDFLCAAWTRISGLARQEGFEEWCAEHIVIDERLMRPSEVPFLLGDSSKARRLLGWKPKASFRTLVNIMVDSALDGEPSQPHLS